MANEKFVKFTAGPISNLASTPKEAGKVYFALTNNNNGVIYYDQDNSTRIQMSRLANSVTVKGEHSGSVDLTSATDATLTLKSNTFVVGYGTTNGVWLGSLGGTGIQTLYDGLTIDFWINCAGASGGDTLNLSMDNGQQSGANPIYRTGTTKLTTQYPVNTILRLVYRQNITIGSDILSGWWVLGDYDTNSFEQLRYQQYIQAGTTAITATNLIVGANGTYRMLKDNQNPFDLTYPIMYAGSNISAGNKGNNNYIFINFTITNTQAINFTNYKPVYLQGTLTGTSFTPKENGITQTLPTASTSVNPHYLLLGIATSATTMYLLPEHKVYSYANGEFCETVFAAVSAETDENNKKITSYIADILIDGQTMTLRDGNNAKIKDLITQDKKVEQSATTSSDYQPLILGHNAVSDLTHLTDTVTDTVNVSNKFYTQPSTGKIFATTFVGNLNGKADDATHADAADIATGDENGNPIASTYLMDLLISNNNKEKVVVTLVNGENNQFATRDIPAASTATAGVITADTTTTQTITGPKIIDANGSLEVKGDLKASKTSGFEYSAIETASGNSARPVWFAHASKNGTPVINTNFTYNPSTKTLKVDNVDGIARDAISDNNGNEIASSYILYGSPAFTVTTSAGTFSYKDGQNRDGSTSVPVASASQAGLMTAVAQTFAGVKTFNDRIVTPINKWGISFNEDSNEHTGFVYSNKDNKNLSLVLQNSASGFMIVTGSDPATWNSGTFEADAIKPALSIKQTSVYVNQKIADTENPSYKFLVNGMTHLQGMTHSEDIEPYITMAHHIGTKDKMYTEGFFGRLYLERNQSISYGVISWYGADKYNWYTYMNDAANGHAPDGGKPSTLGTVTTWAIRSMIENNSGYGWIWEAKNGLAAKTTNSSAATPLMALSSNTGKLYLTNDLNIIFGDTDKFVHFLYDPSNTGASWRTGVLGSGSGNANYFVIQTTTSSTSATAWQNTVRIGQNNFDITFGQDNSSIGIANTNTSSGAGLSLYGGAPESGMPNIGFAYADTTAFGIHGKVTTDNALYSHISESSPTSKGWIWRYGTTNVFSIDYTGFITFNGMKTTGALEIDGTMSGSTYAQGGGGYDNNYNSIIMHGDSTSGTSGLLFISDKTSATSINRTSDRAFIQFHSMGGTYKTEGTNFAENTSGENNRLVIGVGNDATDYVVLQTPGTYGLKHLVGTNEYTILDSNGTVINNPNTSNASYTSTIDNYLVFSDTGNTNGVARGIAGVNGGSDGWTVRGYQTAANKGALEIAVGDDGDEGIYIRQYISGGYKLPFHNNVGATGLSFREIILMAPNTGYTTIPERLYITGDNSEIGEVTADTGQLFIGRGNSGNQLVFDTKEIRAKTMSGTAQTNGTLNLQTTGGKVYVGARTQGLISNAHYSTTATKGSKRYYKILINKRVSWMLTFTIRIYQNYKYFDLVVSGYNYGTSHWYQPKASLINSSDIISLPVKFGFDSSPVTNNYCNLWIMIEADSYTGLDIIDVTNGYTQIEVPGNMFTITEVTAEPAAASVQKTVNAMGQIRISTTVLTSGTDIVDNHIPRWDTVSGEVTSMQTTGIEIDDDNNILVPVDNASDIGTSNARIREIFVNTLTATSNASSWLDGQKITNKPAINITDATDTGSYWPWLRQTNTSSTKWFSFGTLNNSIYLIGSTTSRTANGYDNGWQFDVSNGMFYSKYLRINTPDMSTVANTTYDNAIPQSRLDGVTYLNGRVYFKNSILNMMGDDATIGDVDVAGHIGIKGANGQTGIEFQKYEASKATTNNHTDAGHLTWNVTSSNAADATAGTAKRFTFDKPVEILNPTTDNNALWVQGQVYLGSSSATAYNQTIANGKLIINPARQPNNNSYSEGIRLNNGSNNWSVIAIGGDDQTFTGTQQGLWLIGVNRYNTTGKYSNFYLSYNGSNSAEGRITGHVSQETANAGKVTAFSVRPRLFVNCNPNETTSSQDYNLGYNFEVNGTSRFKNLLTVYRSTTEANNLPAGIVFDVWNETKSKRYSGAHIYAYQDYQTTPYGMNMIISPGGNLILGGGESADNMYGVSGMKGNASEDTYLLSDNVIYLEANAQTIANRIGFEVNTLGELIPVKAEAPQNKQGSIGTSTYYWKTGYIDDIHAATITATTFTGELVGNASTATTWKTKRKIQVDLNSEANPEFDGSADVVPGVKNTLPVKHGGTGTTTFAQGEALIGNTQGAITTRAINNVTAVGSCGWTSQAQSNTLITTNTLSYWNGRYNSSSSNLQYCDRGRFGTIVTHSQEWAVNRGSETANTAIGSDIRPVYVDANGKATQCKYDMNSEIASGTQYRVAYYSTATKISPANHYIDNSKMTIGGTDVPNNLTLYVKGKTTITGVTTVSDTTESSGTGVGAIVTSGGVGIAKALNVGGAGNFGGAIKTTNTTASTSTSTGALIVGGGAGIAGAINAGGVIKTTDATDASSTSTGSIITSGGVGIAKALHVGSAGTFGGNVKINSNTASSNTTTGALVVNGGTGIATNLNVGGTGTFGGAVTINSTTASSSTSTGALIVKGGAGIAGALNIGGNFTTSGVIKTTNATDATSTTTGALIVAGGAGIAKQLRVGGAATLSSTLSVSSTGTFGGAVTINSTTASSTTGNGALIVKGGTGIAGALNVGGVVTITNNTAASSTTTGALKVTGGISSQGNIYGAKVYNAVWNDYAEYRTTVENVKYGQVVCEDGNGNQHITTHRLEFGCNIVSDTFGTAMGKRDNSETPIAVAGRVLAYINENRDMYKPGDAVCSGPNGTISKMSRKEIRRYPEAIIGYVSEIPDYDIWYAGTQENPEEIKVDGRIWIKVN